MTNNKNDTTQSVLIELEEQDFQDWASGEGREEYEEMTNGCDPRDC